jgi:hypothetical protein
LNCDQRCANLEVCGGIILAVVPLMIHTQAKSRKEMGRWPHEEREREREST